MISVKVQNMGLELKAETMIRIIKIITKIKKNSYIAC